jgi:hypothetical protein
MKHPFSYWVITCTKGLSSTIHILYEEDQVIRCQKKYEKDGYICIIEKKN